MPREATQTKGRRYLTEGRLIVQEVAPGRVRAVARGDGATYLTGWTRGAGWWCSCPARGRCSHLIALGLVVAVDEAAES